MQTILGAGGAIGTPLARALKSYGKVRLVARHPRQVNGDDALLAADLTCAGEVDRAVAGSSVVYLVVGLPYKTAVWRREWPLIMRLVIDACLRHDARLVFLDNIYMYAPAALSHMTEDAVVAPVSKKGRVRAQVQDMLWAAVKEQGLQALIARSADFYGPGIRNSPLGITVVDKLRKKQKAFWQMDAGKVHSFTYTPDAALALAMLGNTQEAYGAVWHLPTSSERLTGADFISRVAAEMRVRPRYYIFGKGLMRLLGLFIPMVAELKEMSYQYDRDYFFDSSKFNRRFGFTPTSYTEGIRAVVAAAT